VVGDNGPFKDGLKIDIAGTLDLAPDGSAVLRRWGTPAWAQGSMARPRPGSALSMETRPSASPFAIDVQAQLLEVTLTDIEWDLSPVAIVRAGQVQVLADSGDHGEVADLIDLEVELLPDETDGPLATFTVDRATGFGSLDPELVIDSFRIEGASAAFADLAVADPSDPLLSFTDLVISIPELSNQGETLSGQILVASEHVDLLPGNTDSFEASAVGLSGSVDLDTGILELASERLTGEIDGLFVVEANDGTLWLSPNRSVDDRLFAAAETTLTVPLLGETPVTLTAQDLRIEAGGDASIMSAEAVASEGLAASLGLAGILPLDLTRVAIEAIDEPISLGGFDSDITVEGVFDFSLFPEAFQPTVSIGGDAPDTFALTFRLNDGVIAPWNASPITLGFTAAEVFPGFSLDGDLTLGGYERGVWGPELTGSLTARLDLDGTVETNLTVNVLPGSTLDVTTGTLNLSGEVLLDADADATFGGASLADGRLPFNLLLDVDPINERPFFEVATFDVTFGALTIDELVIELAEAFTLTASEIEVNPGAGQGDPIATIGTLALEVTALSGVTPGAAAHDVQLFDDRLVLTSAAFTFDGTVTVDGTDLLFVHELETVFNGVVIPFGGSLSDFADGNVALPQIPDVEKISVTLEAGILLPEPGTTAADLADICAGEEANGVASICGVTGAFDSNGVLTLTAENINANLTDVFAVHVEDGEIVLGPPALVPTDTPLMALGSATVTVPLLDDKKVSLTGNDLKLHRDGEVTIASAIAEAPAGIGTTLGLGGILPLDLTSVQIASTVAPVSLTNFGDAENPLGFDITVQGFFDFDVFGDLPFTPVIQIGDPLDPETFKDKDGTFDFTFRVEGDGDPHDFLPRVSIQDLGPVTLGIDDFKPGGEDGPLTLNATVTLGGYQDGQLVKAVGGNIDVAWEDEDGPVEFAAGVEVNGQLFDPDEEDNPVQGATTLRLDTTFTGSLALGNQREGGEDESWGLGITDLSFQFLTTLAFDFAGDDVQLVTEPFDAVQLLGLEAKSVAIDFGGLLLLEAEQVAFDFTAFDDADKQFVTFGGDDEDGLLAISVGGEGRLRWRGSGGRRGTSAWGGTPSRLSSCNSCVCPASSPRWSFPTASSSACPTGSRSRCRRSGFALRTPLAT
jgi:hypothetical protein